MKTRVALGVFLSAAMALPLAACNANTAATGGGESSADSGVTINYWLWDDRQAPLYQQCADDFHAANPGITVKITQTAWGQYWETLTTQLAAGNVILLKHASNVPQSAAAFEKLMQETGLPAGCFQNLYATRGQIETIINDPRVQGVALTGSEGAGALVAAQAGRALKKSTMELGGADAFIVLDDADLDKAVKWAVFGRHWNGGQVCCSSKRIIVHESIHDEFVRRYTEGVAQLKAGDPMEASTTLAPLSSQQAADDVRRWIDEAVAHGATATVIGAEVPRQGAFVRPVLLTGVKPGNPIYHHEFFGPVSMIFKVKDEDEAIRLANDSPFGLGGSVFTQDIERGKRVAAQISTGMVYINHPTAVKADLPFGGIRRSGYGRELIGLGLKEFVNHKLVGVTDIDGAF